MPRPGNPAQRLHAGLSLKPDLNLNLNLNLNLTLDLWRGSLLPLGSEAAPTIGPAAQSSGSKLPRHRLCDEPFELIFLESNR